MSNFILALNIFVFIYLAWGVSHTPEYEVVDDSAEQVILKNDKAQIIYISKEGRGAWVKQSGKPAKRIPQDRLLTVKPGKAKVDEFLKGEKTND